MILCESPKIELICADCMDIFETFENKQFDLACVDPPYGIGNFSPTGGSKGVACKGIEWNIKWNEKIPPKIYFLHLKRVSVNRIIFGANYYNCFEDGNGAIIWYKGKINPVFSQCEIASISNQQKVDYYFQNWQGGGNWRGTNIHPCQKPVELYRWLYQNYAKAGDKILDTHLGSGSSAIAAYREGFEFFGIEKDEEYFNAAVERFKRETAQADLFKPKKNVKQLEFSDE